MSEFQNHFSSPQAVAHYAEGPPRAVPGFYDMQRMTALLIAERAAERARVLVIGAGGGLEIKTFAQAYPAWTFDGVDPSAEMLRLAEKTLGPLMPQVHLHEGYADDAPVGPFDAATCLLTLHFLTRDERQSALAEVHARLKPGAPFVAAHFSFPQKDRAERTLWLSRYAAFLAASGIEPGNAAKASETVDATLTLLTPEQDEMILRDAGFSNVSLFYTGFAFRGWVAYA